MAAAGALVRGDWRAAGAGCRWLARGGWWAGARVRAGRRTGAGGR
jgi:hypothetical protein